MAGPEPDPRTAAVSRIYGGAVLDAAPDGMLIVDATGTILLANRQAHGMFGYEPPALIGQPVDALLPDALRAGHAAHRDAYIRAPRTRPMGSGLDLLARRKDGTEFPVEISLSPMATPDGVVVISALRDITERRRIEADLRALNEDLARQREEAERAALALAARRTEKLAALGTLAAGLAHELNNPIGIMSSRIEVMLMEGESLPAHVREDLEVLHRQTQRVARITQGLLTFARTSAGEREPVDLNHVVRETLLLAETQITKRGVTVTVELSPDLRPRAVAHARHRARARRHDRCRVSARARHALRPRLPRARPRAGVSGASVERIRGLSEVSAGPLGSRRSRCLPRTI